MSRNCYVIIPSILIFGLAVVLLYVCYGSFPLTRGETWALLVAGTKNYPNYRHQAVICRAYQTLKNNGVPESNIVVMMYDDVALSSKNPAQGSVISEPKGENVYEAIRIDYSGQDLTAKNFEYILTGNKAMMSGKGSGKVIQSGSNDNIFVAIADEGGSGFFSLGNDLVHASDLDDIFDNLVRNEKFDKMLWFFDGSYCSSIFDDILEKYSKVFVMCGSDHKEPSLACFYDEKRTAYLSNVFSTNWLNFAEKVNDTVTINDLFKDVRRHTIGSHVRAHGDLNMGSEKISHFLGGGNYTKYGQVQHPDPNENSLVESSLPAAMIEHKLQSTDDSGLKSVYKNDMKNLFERRAIIDRVMNKIAFDAAKGNHVVLDKIQNYFRPVTRGKMRCCKSVIGNVSKRCFSMNENPYARHSSFMLVNMCEIGIETGDINKVIGAVCTQIGNKPSGIA